jgi:hypothetical protein
VRLAFVAAAVVVAGTLVDDALQPSVLSHARPPAVYALAALLAGALLLLAPRAGSRPVALGAGIAAGGALATLLGGIVWAGGVPNPFAAHGVAFNVADLAIGGGDALLIGGALLHAWLHRQALRDPV